jgi:hydrogenase expression/formation protein HypD
VTEDPLLHDGQAVAGLLAAIREEATAIEGPATFMEVCGTHTQAVAASGLRRLLPDKVRLISGPGCPVCVTPIEYLDRAIALANEPHTIVATFGDLMRVPSSTSSLEQARAVGARVEVVYSCRDALALARTSPNDRVVFLAVGFETTVPTIAATLAEAEGDAVPNFLILPGNKIMPPPMRALLDDPRLHVDGFLLPGHVSAIVGWRAFRFLADDFGASGVVVGFTPTDVLRGVLELLRWRRQGEARVGNLYSRVVTAYGNTTALSLVDRFFTTAAASWRGFGEIPDSGLGLRAEYAQRDAAVLPVEVPPTVEPAGCCCGDILRGAIEPPECPLFASACTPDVPIGACMVSSEGTCAAWYRHEHW